MGRKSSEKKNRRRNITEYTFDQDGTKYYMSEIHPQGTQAMGKDILNKVSWTHRMGLSAVEGFVTEVLPKMGKKRVFLLTDREAAVLLGFYPDLTDREKGLLENVRLGLDKT